MIINQEENEDDDLVEEEAVLGFWSAFAWLVGMTLIIALLSEYVVGTIEVSNQPFIIFFNHKLETFFN